MVIYLNSVKPPASTIAVMFLGRCQMFLNDVMAQCFFSKAEVKVHSSILCSSSTTSAGGNNARRFDDSCHSQPLVLTHNDLSMRNIIVGHDGKLWLVDWIWSGFYPPLCEYIATKSAAYNDDAPRNWWKYIPLVAGAWLKEENIASPVSANIGYV